MSHKTTILAQDDCAPDAMQVFCKEFIKETGLTLNEFKNLAVYTDDFLMTWELNAFELQIAPDDPYYRLLKVY